MEKVVTIRNNKTGHQTTILKRSWDNASHLYKGYSLVEETNIEYIDPEPEKRIVHTSTILDNADQEEPEETPKPKRRRKKKNDTTEN